MFAVSCFHETSIAICSIKSPLPPFQDFTYNNRYVQNLAFASVKMNLYSQAKLENAQLLGTYISWLKYKLVKTLAKIFQPLWWTTD